MLCGARSMPALKKPSNPPVGGISKCPTGIVGLDQITNGGLPRGRPALICGGAGCGKTLLALEFIVRGAIQFDEPGVFVSFEEMSDELADNVRSLGFDLNDLVKRKKLAMDYVRLERSEIEESGDYDLEGLFVRLNHAIDSVKAKRVVLDTIESLFSGLSDTAILRAELRRLFRWLKDKGVTAVITAEKGEGTLTRHGIEEYVSDCVIDLDHRIHDQLSTRRLRVVKYRGSAHGTNEYPFIIDERGISVLPVTSVGLEHAATTARISSGVERLDTMLSGRGFFRGSSILASGTAGTGKTSLACSFARSTCQNGERCLYFAFEESPAQIMRNVRSVGIDLEPFVAGGLLRFHASRPSLYGLETHLAVMHKQIEAFKPSVVIIDPVTNMMTAGLARDARSVLLRLIDYLKGLQITVFMNSLTHDGNAIEQSEVEISSLIDTWLFVRDIELGGERNRGMYILKSRGMAHSNQIREFVLGRQGVELVDVYLGPAGVLTGSARIAQAAKERAQETTERRDLKRQQAEMLSKRKAFEAQIAALQAQIVAQDQATEHLIADTQANESRGQLERRAMAVSRKADSAGGRSNGKESSK
jgi:circadian clock protein KaiC